MIHGKSYNNFSAFLFWIYKLYRLLYVAVLRSHDNRISSDVPHKMKTEKLEGLYESHQLYNLLKKLIRSWITLSRSIPINLQSRARSRIKTFLTDTFRLKTKTKVAADPENKIFPFQCFNHDVDFLSIVEENVAFCTKRILMLVYQKHYKSFRTWKLCTIYSLSYRKIFWKKKIGLREMICKYKSENRKKNESADRKMKK